ncbi:MAG: SHOCT domain-containing protein [Candidatus Melainabacteria bacterium]|nr:SHOCT domain-containing protein [Candidatus Melainabacteria bacterium]
MENLRVIKTEKSLKADGVNGQIEIKDNKIIISRRGINAFLVYGFSGEKEILIDNITAVQYKQVGWFSNGYIQFTFKGCLEAKRGIREAARDENSIVFKSSQEKKFQYIKDEINKRIQSNNQPIKTISNLDELEKLAHLRDKGIVTEEEFNLKKKELLNI